MSSLVQLDRAAAVPTGAVQQEPATGRGTTAADLMTHRPVALHHSASLWSAWDLLHRSNARHVVVVDDENRPLGVVDDRTIALEWPPGLMAAQRTPVRSLLRGRARPRVLEGAELTTVAGAMVGTGEDALPVVDRDGRLVGLITLWHLAELAATGQIQT